MSTGIPEAELRRTLQSLALGKARVLIKEPLSKEVADSDTFSANDKFTSKSFRLKIPQLVVRDPQPERQAVMELVEDERKGLIEAAIVRVMKSRKTLSHAMLVAEVDYSLFLFFFFIVVAHHHQTTRQLSGRFQASPVAIKARIENLIERDYLQRGEGDHGVYKYLA